MKTDNKLIIYSQTGEIKAGPVFLYPFLYLDAVHYRHPETRIIQKADEHVLIFNDPVIIDDTLELRKIHSCGYPYFADRFKLIVSNEQKVINKLNISKELLKTHLGDPSYESDERIIYNFIWGDIYSTVYKDRKEGLTGGDITIEYKNRK